MTKRRPKHRHSVLRSNHEKSTEVSNSGQRRYLHATLFGDTLNFGSTRNKLIHNLY